jgi:hypothetical protein
MINPKSKDELIECIKNKDLIHSSVFRRLGIDLYIIYTKIHGFSKCKNCDIQLDKSHFKGLISGFKECCSTKCTNLLRYGVTSTLNLPGNYEKSSQTLIERYGVENPGQIDRVKEQVRKTCLERHGHENFGSSEQAKEKRRLTMLERYSVETYSQTQQYKDKVKLTSIEKYGVDHFTQSEKYKENRKLKNPIHHNQEHIKNFQNYNQEFVTKNFVFENKFNMHKAMEYFNVKSKILHRNFEIPKMHTIAETELLLLIEDSKHNDRILIKPLEIDILSNKHKLAIEYNGLMWHSDGKSKSSKFNKRNNKNKHLIKTELVEEKGYQLFHIFENEWINKEKWISVINSKLNNTERIFARKCIIKEINTKECSAFENANHLQSKGLSSVRIGLFYNNELVVVMTFGKSRFNKNYQYELIRFCSLLNTTVVGGGSKLLKYFERNYNPTSIISYANRRWSKGNLYDKLGFELSHITGPNYFYFRVGENILFSRNMFQKHKLKDKLEIFDSKLTETENMFNNGYRKIFDSGNKVYVKEYK